MEESFKHRYFLLYFVVFVFIDVVFLSFTILIFLDKSEGNFWAESFFLCGTVFMILGSIGSIRGQSAVVIDDKGISKILFGKTWRKIQWEEVVVIRSSFLPSYDVNKSKIRTISVYPIAPTKGPSWHNLFKIKRIRFDDNFINFEHLLKLLNMYISKYHIEVELFSKGVKTKADKL